MLCHLVQNGVLLGDVIDSRHRIEHPIWIQTRLSFPLNCEIYVLHQFVAYVCQNLQYGVKYVRSSSPGRTRPEIKMPIDFRSSKGRTTVPIRWLPK